MRWRLKIYPKALQLSLQVVGVPERYRRIHNLSRFTPFQRSDHCYPWGDSGHGWGQVGCQQMNHPHAGELPPKWVAPGGMIKEGFLLSKLG